MKDGPANDKTKAANGGTGVIPGFGSFLNGNNHLWENWAQSNAAVISGTVDIAREMMAFSLTRLKGDFDGWKSLAACQNPNDLAACQMELTETATAQYIDEANKLATRMFEVFNAAATPFREQLATAGGQAEA